MWKLLPQLLKRKFKSFIDPALNSLSHYFWALISASTSIQIILSLYNLLLGGLRNLVNKLPLELRELPLMWQAVDTIVDFAFDVFEKFKKRALVVEAFIFGDGLRFFTPKRLMLYFKVTLTLFVVEAFYNSGFEGAFKVALHWTHIFFCEPLLMVLEAFWWCVDYYSCWYHHAKIGVEWRLGYIYSAVLLTLSPLSIWLHATFDPLLSQLSAFLTPWIDPILSALPRLEIPAFSQNFQVARVFGLIPAIVYSTLGLARSVFSGLSFPLYPSGFIDKEALISAIVGDEIRDYASDPRLNHQFDLYVPAYMASMILFIILSALIATNVISTSSYQAYISIKALLFLIFTVFSGLYFNISPDDSYLWSSASVLNAASSKSPILAFGISKASYFFSSLVLFIFFGVLSFAYPYMVKEQKRFKFLILLFFFTSSMLIFFHSKTLVALIFSWKLIGVTSFFLIGHYNSKISVFKSAFKAMLFNIFSDLVFVLFIALYYKVYGTFDVQSLEALRTVAPILDFYFFKVDSHLALGILLFTFSAVKSAQGFNHVWLLDSMEAPVPASALIHSATLVVTGVFLFATIGSIFLLSHVATFLIVLTLLGTALLSSLCACYQNDLKKALAYSTISNTSVAFLGTLTSIDEAYLNLAVTHGLIKSLCFLICGYFFFFNNHNQDGLFFIQPRPRTMAKIFLCLFFVFSAVPVSPFFTSKHSVGFITSALGLADSYIVGLSMLFLSVLTAAYGSIIALKLVREEATGHPSPSAIEGRDELSSKNRFLLIALLSFTMLVILVYSALVYVVATRAFNLDSSSLVMEFFEEAAFEDGLIIFFVALVSWMAYDYFDDDDE